MRERWVRIFKSSDFGFVSQNRPVGASAKGISLRKMRCFFFSIREIRVSSFRKTSTARTIMLSYMRHAWILTLFVMRMLAQPPQAWVQKSNQNAQILLDIMARYAPEGAGQLGVNGLDEQISVPSSDQPERRRRDLAEALKTLRERFANEGDPLVRQDLQILIDAAEKNIRASETEERYFLPYHNVGETIFFGMRSLLDDQIAPERRKAAIVRLQRYTGLEAGYTPTTDLAENVFRERLKKP
jgi:hypothetical protein